MRDPYSSRLVILPELEIEFSQGRETVSTAGVSFVRLECRYEGQR
jgi:hypothetical protein